LKDNRPRRIPATFDFRSICSEEDGHIETFQMTKEDMPSDGKSSSDLWFCPSELKRDPMALLLT